MSSHWHCGQAGHECLHSEECDYDFLPRERLQPRGGGDHHEHGLLCISPTFSSTRASFHRSVNMQRWHWLGGWAGSVPHDSGHAHHSTQPHIPTRPTRRSGACPTTRVHTGTARSDDERWEARSQQRCPSWLLMAVLAQLRGEQHYLPYPQPEPVQAIGAASRGVKTGGGAHNAMTRRPV